MSQGLLTGMLHFVWGSEILDGSNYKGIYNFRLDYVI